MRGFVLLCVLIASLLLPLIQSQLVYNTTTNSVFTNCVQLVANRLRFEWTIDTVGQRLFARATFVYPSYTVNWGGVGFTENTNGIPMANSTITVAYYEKVTNKQLISDMYTLNANSNPNLYSSKYFISANFTKLTNGGSRLYLVRTLAKPAQAPAGYFAFSSTRNQNIIMALSLKQPNSFLSLLPHDVTGKLNLNFYPKNAVWNCPMPITEQEVSSGGTGGGGGTTPKASTNSTGGGGTGGGGTNPGNITSTAPSEINYTLAATFVLLLFLNSVLLLLS